tara:strand:+ start:1565 stop:2749 length:1185 start_codon:yes stop_codon:yes gene_type:complete
VFTKTKYSIKMNIKRNNLHISMTAFKHESRVLKETKTIARLDFVDHVFIAALHEESLAEEEIIDKNRTLKRFKLRTRRLPKNIFFQLIKYFEFFLKLYFFYKSRKVSMINIHVLALMPIGVLLKFLFSAKLVYDTHELETETISLKGIRKRLAKILEKVLIIFCDRIICVNKSIADWYKNRYSLKFDPLVIINSPEDMELSKKKNLFRQKFKLNIKQKICLYQGGLSRGRGIEMLLKNFSVRKLSDWVIVFMGYGPLEDEILIHSENNNNIFFHPAVRPEQIYNYTSSADLGLLFFEKEPLSYALCLPNKFFEYAMSGLPILSSDNIEYKNYIKKYNCGIYVSPNNYEGINKILSNLNESEISRFADNSLKMFRENSWQVQEKKLKSMYLSLLK